MRMGVVWVAAIALGAGLALSAQEKPSPPQPPTPQKPGRSEPTFQWPSIAPGVDYTLPTEAEIKAPLDRVRDFFVRSTPYRIIDTATGAAVTDLRTPSQDGRHRHAYRASSTTGPIRSGVTLAGMLHVADVTGDKSFEEYTYKNFDFIFDHLEYLPRSGEARSVRSRRATAGCSTCTNSMTAARSARR